MKDKLFKVIFDFFDDYLIKKMFDERDVVVSQFFDYIQTIVQDYEMGEPDNENKRIMFYNEHIHNELICECSEVPEEKNTLGMSSGSISFYPRINYGTPLNSDFIGRTIIRFNINNNMKEGLPPFFSFSVNRIRKIPDAIIIEKMISSGDYYSTYNARTYSNAVVKKFEREYFGALDAAKDEEPDFLRAYEEEIKEEEEIADSILYTFGNSEYGSVKSIFDMEFDKYVSEVSKGDPIYIELNGIRPNSYVSVSCRGIETGFKNTGEFEVIEDNGEKDYELDSSLKDITSGGGNVEYNEIAKKNRRNVKASTAFEYIFKYSEEYALSNNSPEKSIENAHKSL